MPSSNPCPECGEYSLYRSKAKTLKEKITRRLTRYRLYRCRECKWRGWLRKPRYSSRKEMLRDLIFFAIPIIIGIILLIWLMNR